MTKFWFQISVSNKNGRIIRKDQKEQWWHSLYQPWGKHCWYCFL